MTTAPISIQKCADQLTAGGDTVSRSALSRYIKDHGIATVKRGREKLVDFQTVKDHRDRNVMRKIMKGEPMDGPPPGPTPPASPNLFGAQAFPAAAPTAATGPEDASAAGPVVELVSDEDAAGNEEEPSAGNVAQLDPRRRMYEVKARAAEREELEVLGRLVPVEEMDAGVADALAATRQHGKAALRDAVQRAAAEMGLDAGALPKLRRHMQALLRDSETRLADEFAALVQASYEDRAAAHSRLMRVSAFALKQRGLPGSAREFMDRAAQA